MSPQLHPQLQAILSGGMAVFLLLGGCDKKESPGSAENLKADYDRVVHERDQIKADYEKKNEEIARTWRQRIANNDERAAELITENASLRQRLLTTESALNEIPLVDTARNRSVMWLHLTYGLIILGFLVLLVCILWVHANLRERVRMHLINQLKLSRLQEAIDVRQTRTTVEQ
jgi:hypothetical protein